MKSIVCDRCGGPGKVFDDPNLPAMKWLPIEMRLGTFAPDATEQARVTYDLCGGCNYDLDRWRRMKP